MSPGKPSMGGTPALVSGLARWFARALVVLSACAPPAPARQPQAVVTEAALGVELVESVPIETSLDHPALRDAAEVWREMIEGATTSIDLAQFYASNAPGSRLEPVVAALEAALARGVRVRFLAEHKFSKVYPDTLARLARAGATVRLCDLSATSGGILHAKYFVIDGREAFLGSQNFDWRALEHIYELGARLRQPQAVAQLGQIFAADWAQAGGEPAPTGPGPDVGPGPAAADLALVASPRQLLPPGVAWDLPRLVELIDGAARSIHVQLLTYRARDDGAPWDELQGPLLRAAARGVRVQLLLADWSKRPGTLSGLQQLVRAPHHGNLEVRLVTIPPWSGGFIPYARVTHAKLLVVDGARGWVGTSNWEKDYFYQSRNVGLVMSDRRLAAQLEQFFASVWTSPYAAVLDPDAPQTPPRIE